TYQEPSPCTFDRVWDASKWAWRSSSSRPAMAPNPSGANPSPYTAQASVSSKDGDLSKKFWR
ncbi:hypothetical protein GW17_00022200, partial [Ensete ventricosum]